MQFHHVGIPTQTAREGETFLDAAGVHITDAAAVEFMQEC